jgi:hypothetical protein
VAEAFRGFMMSTGIESIVLFMKASMSLERKARSEESADMPIVSRSLKAQVKVVGGPLI